MKPKDLRKLLYYAYHSLDPAQAIERFLEGSGSKEEDYTEKGALPADMAPSAASIWARMRPRLFYVQICLSSSRIVK